MRGARAGGDGVNHTHGQEILRDKEALRQSKAPSQQTEEKRRF